MLKDLKEADAKTRLYFYEKLLAYVVPKQQSIGLSVDFDRLSEEQLDNIIDRLRDNE